MKGEKGDHSGDKSLVYFLVLMEVKEQQGLEDIQGIKEIKNVQVIQEIMEEVMEVIKKEIMEEKDIQAIQRIKEKKDIQTIREVYMAVKKHHQIMKSDDSVRSTLAINYLGNIGIVMGITGFYFLSD